MRKPLWTVFLLLGAAVRLVFLLQTDWIEGDCSVMGLIAKHISEGTDFSAYLWLAHYSGTLSAWITAVWFKLLGVSPQVYQLTGLLFTAAQAALAYLLARRLVSARAALIATGLVLLPTYELLKWMFLYQYGDSLALGWAVLLLLVRYAEEPLPEGPLLPASAGLLTGLGLWTSPLFFPYLVTEAVVFSRRRSPRARAELGWWAGAAVLGYLPAIAYNVRHPGAQLHRMAGRFLAVDRGQWEGSHHKVLLILKQLLLKIGGMPETIAWMPSQFAALTNWLDVLLLAAGAGWALRRREGRPKLILLFLLVSLVFHAALVGEHDHRYMFPLYLPFALLTGQWLADLWDRSRAAAGLALALLFGLHGWTLIHGSLHPERMSVGELVAFLKENGVRRAYADYWLAYPVTFQSKEEIIVSPTLLHPTMLDRNPAYTELVQKDPQAAFLLDRGRDWCVEAPIEEGLKRLGIRYEKDEVKEFAVYRAFSKAVTPEALDLQSRVYAGVSCRPR